MIEFYVAVPIFLQEKLLTGNITQVSNNLNGDIKMATAHKVRRKRKEHAGDLFGEVNSLIGGVYKVLSKKGGLLHGLVGKTRKRRTHSRKRHK